MSFSQGDDRPLDCHWQTDLGILDRAGVYRSTRRGEDLAKASIIAGAVVERLGANRRISYSRRNDWYAAAPRYTGMAYSRRLVCGLIDSLEGTGKIWHAKAEPGAHLKKTPMQSAFWASDKLVELVGDMPIRHVGPKVPVVIRREDGSFLDIPDTERARRIVRETEAVNEALRSIRVGVDPEADPADLERGPYAWRARKVRPSGKVTWATVVPTDPMVVRIFSRERFDHNGRLYGWWQNLPKARRRELMINNELIIEPDFSALHPTLLYAMEGIALAHDPYVADLRRWSRSDGKLALNVAINAPTRRDAVEALLAKREEEADDGTPKWKHGRRQTGALIEALIERNRPIARHIGSDAGIRLMGVDSRMCLQVMKRCRKDGVSVLPVHDSFMVGRSNEGVVKAHMEAVLDQTRVELYSGLTRVSGVVVPTNESPCPGNPLAKPEDTLAPVVVPAPVLDTPVPGRIPGPGEDTSALTGLPCPGGITPARGLSCALADPPALVGIRGLETHTSSRSVASPSEPRTSPWDGRGLAVLPSSEPRTASPVLPVLAVPWAVSGCSPEPHTPATLNLVLDALEPILVSDTAWHDLDPLPCTMTLDGEVVMVAGGLRRPYAMQEMAAGRDPWAHLSPEARPVGWHVVPRVAAGYIQASSCEARTAPR
ncbi:hypothetical protein HNR00_003081 [Methylorubrum rhodinum]|uniref:Uncharacterized protein n=1 Tax=Methylorubrum rhodinum TaxID=29428 RepID=A0A840ZN69_9HYPH|nr:hypothetical protein [Methylorubrum rhodinum]MBB5758361.1 hypothetical protein [Methylorubrum rhodinum]